MSEMKKKSFACVNYLFILLFLLNIVGTIDFNSFQIEDPRDLVPKVSDSDINIITPKNQLYNSPMSGFYPSIYGFEEYSAGTSGEDITFLEAWTVWGDTIIVDELDKHKNILSCTKTGPADIQLKHTFHEYYNTGIIEFWYRTTSAFNYPGKIYLRDVFDIGPYIAIDDGHFGYDAGGGPINLVPCSPNRWYHLKIEWFSNNTFDFYVNNEIVLDGGGFYDTLSLGVDILSLVTQGGATQYFDAFGFSWYSEYSVGDNFEQGLLLNYETVIDLVWQGYSLDGQANITLLGNHTIAMPDSGSHTIQVFGNDSLSNYYESEIRAFSIDYNYTRTDPIFIDDSDINFDWNKTATENAWCSGSGTVVDPYIIKYLIIDGSDYSSCITIQNSNISFIIRNFILYCSYYYLYYDITFIKLINVNNSRFQQINCSYGDRGIQLRNCHYNEILENNFKNLYSNAIYFMDASSHNKVASNIINGEGIEVASGKYNDFSENVIENGGNGFFIFGNCENTTLWKNIVNNNYEGIELQGTSHLIISENIITNSKTYGIAIYTVSNCDFIDNYIANCTRGVVIGAGSYYNNFTLNEIRNNSDYGLKINFETENQNNTICNNEFIGNAIQAHDNGINNYWNNSMRGNYWDDYKGYDLNGDFIGDDPYDIPGTAGSLDYLPIWNWTGNDNIEPKITINMPQDFNVSGYDPPEFNIYIEEYSLEDVWYTLNNSLVKVFILDNGTVDPGYWDTINHGLIPLTFYANDTSGNIGNSEILIYKDLLAPNITILGPHPEYWQLNPQDTYPSYWKSNPPTFELLINEPVDRTWYTIDGGKHNITFTGLKGTINQNIWGSMPDGEVTIIFYAEDLVGNIGYAEVTINKLFDVTEYYPVIILGVVGFSSILSIFIIRYKRRRKRHVKKREMES